MIVISFFRWLFFLLALLMLILGLWLWLSGEDITKPAGALWYAMDVSSLNLAQVVIQRHLHLPALWDEFIVPYLLVRAAWETILWMFITFMVLGGLLALATRAPRRKSSFRNDFQ